MGITTKIERSRVDVEIITNTTDFYLKNETAVAIGKFDGLHIGHRRLLDEILAQKKNGLTTCVFTFHPNPAVFFGLSDGKELNTREEKQKLLERMGIDILIEFPLNQATASMEPTTFVTDILSKRINVRFIAAGTDLSFGAGGKGNAQLLQKMEEELNFRVKIIEKVCYEGHEVSSTYIRTLLGKGEIQLVEQLLGMPYTIQGTVQHGNRIGRTLGMPTVNLLPSPDKLMPPCGVYDSSVVYEGKRYKAITNVGYKPTVTEEKVMGVESYLYDFNQDIYGKEIQVCLYKFKRPEQKFENLEALKAQLQIDIKGSM